MMKQGWIPLERVGQKWWAYDAVADGFARGSNKGKGCSVLSSCVWTLSASLGVASERRSSAATWRTIDLYVYHCQPCNACSRVVGHPLLIEFFLGNVHPTRHQIKAMTKWKFFTRLTTSSRKSEKSTLQWCDVHQGKRDEVVLPVSYHGWLTIQTSNSR